MSFEKTFKYNYQDASLLQVTFLSGNEIKMKLKLDTIMNLGNLLEVEITFFKVENYKAIQKYFETFKRTSFKEEVLDEIHSLTKISEHSYQVEFFNNPDLNIISSSSNFSTAIQ